jgi:hypothetical protein
MSKKCCGFDYIATRRQAFREAAQYLRDSLGNPKYSGMFNGQAVHHIADDITELGEEKEIDLGEACHDAYDIVSHGSGGDQAP